MTEHLVIEIPGYEGTPLLNNAKKYKIIGLETNRPILQIDKAIFVGRVEETVGTHLIFTQNSEHVAPSRDLFAVATKKIVFQRIRVEKRK